MTTVEDLQLLLIDPESGATMLGSTENDAVLGGAILFDLLAVGRLALVGEGRRARVEVTDPAPLGDPLLEAAFSRVRDRRPARPKDVVTRLGRKTRTSVVDSLVAQDVLRRRDAKALGLFPLTRFDVVDVARQESLRAAVLDVLARRREADATTGPLIGLLAAGGLVKKVVRRDLERRPAEKRAAEVADGDWASAGVKQAIQAAQAAMMAAVTAATAAGAASAGS